MARVIYYPDDGLLYVEIGGAPREVVRSENVGSTVVLDYGANDELIGVEVLGVDNLRSEEPEEEGGGA